MTAQSLGTHLKHDQPDSSGAATPAASQDASEDTPRPKAAAPKPARPSSPIAPPAGRARLKRRHLALVLSFVLAVVLPSLTAAWYLWTQAQDQYASHMGFTVRREEAPSAVDLIGGLASLSSSSSSDSDVLYEFIQSQELVKQVDEALDLRALYSRHHDDDPVFSLAPDASIEDLVNYWQRVVQISYAPGTGLIELKSLAFTPEEAQAVATEIFRQSTRMINALSAIAREDTMRYAREELALAQQQLTEARQALTAYRTLNQIVDPSADIQIQMGLLTTLQQQLGNELIDYDLLRDNAQPGDPRIAQAEQRIAAIRSRIEQERSKFGGGGDPATDYPTIVAEFERLTVERQFAEQKYTGALSNFDTAQAEAQRQSRYLAAFVQPTLAERAEYPRRALIMALVVLLSTVAWSILALIYYSLRDRK